MTDYDALKVTELRQLAKERGISSSGKLKKDLIKLLKEHPAPAEQGTVQEKTTSSAELSTEQEATPQETTNSAASTAGEKDSAQTDKEHAQPSSDIHQDKQDSDKHVQPVKSSDDTAAAATDEKTSTEQLIEQIHHSEETAPVEIPTLQKEPSHVAMTTAAPPADPEKDNAIPSNDAHAALLGTASENAMQGNVPAGAEIADSERVVDSMAIPEAAVPNMDTGAGSIEAGAAPDNVEVMIANERVDEEPLAFDANDADALLKRRIEEEKNVEDRVAKKVRMELDVEPIGGSAMLK